MERPEIEFHLETLREWDELDLVDALRLTSEDIIVAFQEKAEDFIREEWE